MVKLGGFIDTGADEAILNSLPTQNISDDLVKAMNREGLVQKEVTVQGKNGETFTRKQWVRASEAKTDTNTSQPTMTEKEFYKKYPNGGMQDPVECLKHNGSNATWHGEKLQNPSVMKRAKEEYAQFKKDKAALEAGKSKTTSDDKKPTGTNIIDKKNGTVKHSDSAGNDFKTYTDKQSGTVNMVGKFDSDSKKKIIEGMQKKGYEIDKEHTGKLPDGNEQVSFKKKSDDEPIDEKNMKMMDKIKKETKFTSHGKLLEALDVAINSDDDKINYEVESATVLSVEDYKGNGPKGTGTVDRVRIKAEVTAKDNNNNKITKVLTISTKRNSQDNEPQQNKSDKSSQKANYFKAAQATKDKVNQMSTDMGNDKLLEYAKQNGVSWKEHDHKGINIMRMKMALAEAIENGKLQ